MINVIMKDILLNEYGINCICVINCIGAYLYQLYIF